MEELIRDLKLAAKLLWREKSFSITAVATLSLCIGANAAIFGVVNSVLLRPLPFPESDRIHYIYTSYPKSGVERTLTSVPHYLDRLEELDVYKEQALYRFAELNFAGGDVPEQVRGMEVTPSLLRLLQIRPLLGRVFTREEGESGNELRAILSYGFWQRTYGGDESALGKDLRINGIPHTIVGVMPEDFLFIHPDIQVLKPAAFTEEQRADEYRHDNAYHMLARLKPGATLEQAQSQLDAHTARELDRIPEAREALLAAGFDNRVVRLQDDLVRNIRGTLLLLWGGVFFVLLIGCLNIANLVLVRSTGRTKELGIRLALGASGWRLTRQTLTEMILLTSLSGGLGLILGQWSLSALATLGSSAVPRGAEIQIDGAAVAFTLGLAVLAGVVLGVIPAARMWVANLSPVIHEEGRGGTIGRSSRTVRTALVVAQFAFAFILLAGAGLLLASFYRVLAVEPGFEPDKVLTASVNLRIARYDDESEVRNFVPRALEALRRLPGVTEAGATDSIPLGGYRSNRVILAEGHVMTPGEAMISPQKLVVSPGYFHAMGIRLVRGRYFDETDTEDSLTVAIVDERLARKFWPGTDAIGKRLVFPSNDEQSSDLMTVVGVVGEVKSRDLVDAQEPVGAFYFPYAQFPLRRITFAMKTATDPNDFVGSARAAMVKIDPDLPFYDIRTMNERLKSSLLERRTSMSLTVGFGAVALLLAAVGIYGVLAFVVAQRTREIGIRLALGSGRQRIVKLILKDGLLILSAGFSLGLSGAVALSRFIEGQLFGVEPLDRGVLALVGTLLLLVALAACLIPARRATRVDPATALRHE